jgi:hypothetical protein
MNAKQFVKKINTLIEGKKEDTLRIKGNEHIEKVFSMMEIYPVKHQTSYKDELSSLINNYEMSQVEIGMFSFLDKYSVSDNFLFFGKIDMDLLGAKRDTREIILVDHDDENFIMLRCAKNSESFLDFLFLYTEFVVNKVIGSHNFDWPNKEIIIELCGGSDYTQFVDFICGTSCP